MWTERFLDIISFLFVIGIVLFFGYSLLPHEHVVLSTPETIARIVGFVVGGLFCLWFWLINGHPRTKETQGHGNSAGAALIFAFTVQAVVRLLFGEPGIQVLVQFSSALGFVGLGFLVIFLGIRRIRGDE